MGEYVCTVPACVSAQEQGHQWDSELGHQWDSELYSSIHFSKKTNEHSPTLKHPQEEISSRQVG